MGLSQTLFAAVCTGSGYYIFRRLLAAIPATSADVTQDPMKLNSTLLTAAFGPLCSTLFRVLMALSLLGCLEANAQTPPTFATLDAKVDALQGLVETLQKQLAESQQTNAAQAAAIAALQRQVNLIATNPVLAIGPFVTVNPNAKNELSGPSIIFHGANIHIEQPKSPNP
jgi:hypothetical protein